MTALDSVTGDGGDAPILPAGSYAFLTSSVREGYAGRTMALLRRARLFSEIGGRPVTVLVFHGDINWSEHRAYFAREGFVAEGVRVLDFYEWLRGSDLAWAHRIAAERGRPEFPDWLTDARARGTLDLERRFEAEGLVVREYTKIEGARRIIERFRPDGSLYVASRRLEPGFDWDHRDRPTVVFDHDGQPLAEFSGVHELYRIWLRELRGPHERQYLFADYRPVSNCLIREGLEPWQHLAVTVHNAHTKEPRHWNSPISDRWEQTFERISGYDQIVTLTSAQRRDLEALLGPRDTLATLPHPLVDQPAVAGVERDPNLCLVVARLEPQKDVAHAIRAFALVAQSHPRARLEIYGDGSRREQLERLVTELGLGERVTFGGFSDQVAGLYARAAALLFTSRWEGQGMTIPEAFAQGCPVIAYDVKYGPGDMIVSGENGLLLERRNVAHFAEAVGSVLGDAALRERLSAGARRSAERYAPRAHILGWRDLIEGMVARKPDRVRLSADTPRTERLTGIRGPGALQRALGKITGQRPASGVLSARGPVAGRLAVGVRVAGAHLDGAALDRGLDVRLRLAHSSGLDQTIPARAHTEWAEPADGGRGGVITVEWQWAADDLANWCQGIASGDGPLTIDLMLTLRNDGVTVPVRARTGRVIRLAPPASR